MQDLPTINPEIAFALIEEAQDNSLFMEPKEFMKVCQILWHTNMIKTLGAFINAHPVAFNELNTEQQKTVGAYLYIIKQSQ